MKKIDDKEMAVFEHAMKDVVKLDKKPVVKPSLIIETPAKRKSKPPPISSQRKPAEQPQSIVDPATVNRVRRAEYPIEGRIDLHGMTLTHAHERLSGFIEASYQQKKRCVLVITGKGNASAGKGVLREDVPRWLQHSSLSRYVSVISSAQPKHGGQGAYYVLLRRKR